MRLGVLLDQIPELVVHFFHNVEITGICAHSQEVLPGDLFVARQKGLESHILEALSKGAVGIVSESLYLHLPTLQLIHPDLKQAEEKLALSLYGRATNTFSLIGITGTNGKTTTSYLVKHLLERAGISCGLIGGIETIIGDQNTPSRLTTPDFLTLRKHLSQMQQSGQRAAVMEVASHGLDQGRVRGLEFQAAVFTNLTQDHLDYHGTMETYAKAKRKLFSGLCPHQSAILNADDPWAPFFHCSAKILTYGTGQKALLQASGIELSSQGLRFDVQFGNQRASIASRLIGKFNVYNLLGALGVGLTFDLSLEESIHYLEDCAAPPGRMCPVPNSLAISIFVDYAHSPDALHNVLTTLNQLKTRRIITVFGCGGNRDRTKRPQMGRIVESLSDLPILTSDNPRSEDPLLIAEEVARGMQSRPLIELDRYKAIEKALYFAEPGDIVLIAGKGHEKVQIFAHETLVFDDFAVANELAKKR